MTVLTHLLRLVTILFFAAILGFGGGTAFARMPGPPPEIMDAIIIGDRAVNIAYHLRVLPKAMSVRKSIWPLADKLGTASRIIGCPNKIIVKNKEILPEMLKKSAIKWVIIEKSKPFCLYHPYHPVNPEQAVALIKNPDIKIDYVDFSAGIESAIISMGKLLNKPQQAEKLKLSYAGEMSRVKKILPQNALNKKVVIFNGVLQKATGKGFLCVEAPGYYSDKLFLEPLGLRNVGQFVVGERKVNKGHVTVRSLKSLITAQPDIIVTTGSALPFQRALVRDLKKYPELADVPAIRDQTIYSLPQNIGSDVIEYPNQLLLWTKTLLQ